MRILLTLLTVFLLTGLNAQRLDHRQGELIVQLGGDVDAKQWASTKGEIASVKRLSRVMNVWLLRFDHDRHAIGQLRHRLWQDPAVETIQLNYLVTQRRRPDDTRYDDQWQNLNVGQINGLPGADHNLEPAWDVTTGGLTANGDTIVVAVIDDGVDLDHEDLVANLWRNHNEIPDNGIDDDNNGYVDDYYGYDTADEDGDPGARVTDNHGTPVNGLVGATGNNSRGVAGANWNVKLMNVRNRLVSAQSEVIQAYSYVLEAKMRYLETDGAEGAYVVATNASWGSNRARPEDSPIWCSLYDSLGKAGVLNAGATINAGIDVDIEGDLPTNCTSDFLVSVTNLNTFDEKVRLAGFGSVSIDLGAYGQDVFTTVNGNGYGNFGGTSAATPSVAGAIALLFAAPCGNFGELLIADPAVAALRVREALLGNVRPNASLAGITATGGRLDVGAAMNSLMAAGGGANGSTTSCADCLTPTSFRVVATEGSATALTVDWRAGSSLDAVNVRYRPVGGAWMRADDVTAPYRIEGLPACVAYEVQLTGNCGGATVETETLSVSTDGCCVIPDDFRVTARSGGVFRAEWTELLAGSLYRVRYRRAGTEEWLRRTSNRDFVDLAGGIAPCTDYEFEFQTDCDTLLTDYGNRLTVTSLGCGACNEANYCVSDDYDNTREWIREVDLGGILRQSSGRETGGYRSFGEVANEPFVRGGTYPVRLRAGTDSDDSSYEFRVYLDVNQDGFFSMAEVLTQGMTTGDEPLYANLTIPADAELLLTRMRVIVAFQGVRNGPCPINDEDGEAEDYCLRIVEADGCPPPTFLDANYDIVAEETLLRWRAAASVGGSYRLRYRLRDSSDDWVTTDVDSTLLTLNDINLCGAYEVEIASLCGGAPGAFRRFLFNDVCTGNREPRLDGGRWSVFPNPAAGRATVSWRDGLAVETLRVYDLTGKQVLTLTPGAGDRAELNLDGLPGGVYVLRLVAGDGRTGVRRLVVR